jgi:hypothetical protein
MPTWRDALLLGLLALSSSPALAHSHHDHHDEHDEVVPEGKRAELLQKWEQEVSVSFFLLMSKGETDELTNCFLS